MDLIIFIIKQLSIKIEFIEDKKLFLSKEKKLTYQPTSDYTIVLPNNSNADNYSVKTNLDNIKLPIKKGNKVGTLNVYKNNKLEKSIDLVAKNDVNSIFSFITKNKILDNILKIALLLVILIFIVFIIFIINKGKHKEEEEIYTL